MTVRINNITAGYGKVPILKDISVELPSGQFCALVGPNGSGKTTLMRCINAILTPFQGQILIDNQDVSRLSRSQTARLIGFVPQSTQSVFAFTVIEMVLMGGATRIKAWSAPTQQDKQKAHLICEEIGIDHLTTHSFQQLSGGQKQLVMLARALFQETPVLLLDEPTSNLDFCNQHKMMNLVRDVIKRKNATALITLHDPNLVLNYCDSAVLMKEGRLIASGQVGTTLCDTNLQTAFGDNIQTDTTSQGMSVIVPKQLFFPQNAMQKQPKEHYI
ncbi:ABC transporter ATP-binding protein [Sporomusa malonica]|uniref:Iron complex transport system ATP-binding protein n=1 Tax=Sporomusa malonica TaxID=112901 RepID=A0A1W2DQQ3_9FIRM|nr:ABC transporter ATP-binding protein [Sporomusa malonica]SMC99830.1 iron complex transport system ATP-binding protein [Sporomusa malonica]